MDFLKPDTVLDLANIREALQRMEDTIIYSLIERSQFLECPSVYKADVFPIPNFQGSFLDWLLCQTERTQSQVRRYQSPDEYPFFPEALLPPFLPQIDFPPILASYSKEINLNSKLMKVYQEQVVPHISAGSGDQMENLGSTAMSDIDALQALSRRIHFGMFVAEAKFRQDPDKYRALIKANDVDGIDAAITNKVVEEKILVRLLEKGKAYGTDPSLKFSQHIQAKVRAETIVRMYKEYVIPLTKEIEVAYLLRRLEVED